MRGWIASFKSKAERFQEKTGYTHEYLLIGFLIIVSAYAYLETRGWPESTALWPRNLALYIFIGSVLLLFRNYLPDVVQPFFEESRSAGTVEDEQSDLGSESTEDTTLESEDEHGHTYTRSGVPDHLVTAIAIIGYALVSYLIGMFWATPIFVLAYCLWFKISPLKTVILVALGVSVAYGFESILNLPIMEGVIND